MSITMETALEHARAKAVTCCRTEAGETLTPDVLEDPAIFPDLQDTGLLEFPEEALTIEEVLGGTLKVTIDALMPLTPDLVELPEKKITAASAEAEQSTAAEAEAEEKGQAMAGAVATGAAAMDSSDPGPCIHIHIGEGKDITLKIPYGAATPMAAGTGVGLKSGRPLPWRQKRPIPRSCAPSPRNTLTSKK